MNNYMYTNWFDILIKYTPKKESKKITKYIYKKLSHQFLTILRRKKKNL